MKAIDLSNLNLFGKLVDRYLDDGCYYCTFNELGNDVIVYRFLPYGGPTPKSEVINDNGKERHVMRMVGRLKDGVRTYTMTDSMGNRVEASANLINSLARDFVNRHKLDYNVAKTKPTTENIDRFGILRGITLLPDRFDTMKEARTAAAEMAGVKSGSCYTVVQLFDTVRLVEFPPPPPAIVWSNESV